MLTGTRIVVPQDVCDEKVVVDWDAHDGAAAT
jgi:hypothetical protein